MLQIAEDYALPLEAVTQTFGLLAIRGSGKTYTAAVMIEEMVKQGLPVCVIDPVGSWWGLRSNAAGDGPGLPVVVMGGDHADLPLERSAGAAIAELVIEERIPLVLDLSHLRKGQQTEFMTEFAERLYHGNRDALHLVIDEADAYAPQRPLPGQQRMLGAMEDLVRRGRARGIGVTLITQRPAVLNKDVLTQVQVLMVLRLVSPQDRAAIDLWVQAHGTQEERDQLMASLASLPVGDAWLWSPGWLGEFRRIHIRRRETFDSSATPKVGEQRIEPRVLADVDLDRLRDRLGDVAESTAANDPKMLKKRIAELEHEVKARPVERVDVPVIDPALAAEVTECREAIEDRFQDVTTSAAQLFGAIERLIGVLERPLIATAAAMKPAPPVRATKPAPEPIPIRPLSAVDAGDVPHLKSGALRMLRAIAQFSDCGLTKQQLSFLSGFSIKSSTYSEYLGAIKRAGLVEDRGRLYATERGRFVANVPIMSDVERLRVWTDGLKAGAGRMLAILTEHGRAITREQLSAESGFSITSSTFSEYVGMLRRLDLIEDAPNRTLRVRASAWYPAGMPALVGVR